MLFRSKKYSSYTEIMHKMLKDLVILLHILILQGYGKMNSTMFVFLRRQGWGFATHVLILKKKEINVKG